MENIYPKVSSPSADSVETAHAQSALNLRWADKAILFLEEILTVISLWECTR